jgi:hypothetical protein
VLAEKTLLPVRSETYMSVVSTKHKLVAFSDCKFGEGKCFKVKVPQLLLQDSSNANGHTKKEDSVTEFVDLHDNDKLRGINLLRGFKNYAGEADFFCNKGNFHSFSCFNEIQKVDIALKSIDITVVSCESSLYDKVQEMRPDLCDEIKVESDEVLDGITLDVVEAWDNNGPGAKLNFCITTEKETKIEDGCDLSMADLCINIQQEANKVCALIEETEVVKYEAADCEHDRVPNVLEITGSWVVDSSSVMKASECMSVDETSEVEYSHEGFSIYSNPNQCIIPSPCNRVLQVKAGSDDTKEVKPADAMVILEIPLNSKQALVGLPDTRSTEELYAVDEPENVELNCGDLVSCFYEDAVSQQNTVTSSQVTYLGTVGELCTSETEPPRQPVKMHVSEASYIECVLSGISEETTGYNEPDTVDNGCSDTTGIGKRVVSRVQKPNHSEHEITAGETEDSDMPSQDLDIKQELRQDKQTKDTVDVDWKYRKVKVNEIECDEPSGDTLRTVGVDRQESSLTTPSSKFTGPELPAAGGTEPSLSTQSSLSDVTVTSFGVSVVGTPLSDVQGSSSLDVQPKKCMYTSVIYVN